MSMTLNLSHLPLGTRLKLRRMAVGLKQAELAAAIGVHTSRVCEADQGEALRAGRRRAPGQWWRLIAAIARGSARDGAARGKGAAPKLPRSGAGRVRP